MGKKVATKDAKIQELQDKLVESQAQVVKLALEAIGSRPGSTSTTQRESDGTMREDRTVRQGSRPQAPEAQPRVPNEDVIQATREQSVLVDGGSHRLPKIPDPQPLTDGTKPFIDDWLSAIRTKLKSHAILYHTEELRMGYVKALVYDPAMSFIRPRLDSDYPHPYTTAEEVLDQLKRSLGKSKATKRSDAKTEWGTLYQRDRDYPPFWADFQRVATTLDIHEEDLVEELRNRLSSDLKDAIVNSEYEDVYEMADNLMILESRAQAFGLSASPTGSPVLMYLAHN